MPTDHSNILLVPKEFALCKKYSTQEVQNKIQSLELAVTGVSSKPSPGSTDLESHVDHVEKEGRPTEEIWEKPEIISTIH